METSEFDRSRVQRLELRVLELEAEVRRLSDRLAVHEPVPVRHPSLAAVKA